MLKRTINSLEPILFLNARQEPRGKSIAIDTLLAIIVTIIVTIIIYSLNLYPRIPTVSFFYLLIVLGLSCTRGLYAALVASFCAFLSFDFFLVDPIFTLTIARVEEWLALCIFLITAIITGQLASALRQRAAQATAQAQEMRELYELVNAATSEKDLERQLQIVAQAVAKNFSIWGIVDCGIYLAGDAGKPVLRASAYLQRERVSLFPEEQQAVEMVLREGVGVDLYNGDTGQEVSDAKYQRYTRILLIGRQKVSYVRLLPLQIEQRVIGVIRLLIDGRGQSFPLERSLTEKSARLAPQHAFFWTFLDQAATMIERARLRREALQIEVLQRTDALRAALLSSVSHDLRTPLSSIKAAASSLLQKDVQWDEEARQSFVIAIEREADRLNRLVGNLLDMSRIEGGAIQPEKEWYPLDELIRDVLGRMQTILQGRNVEFSLPAELPPVELDYLQIDQVLTNLLENAVRYTPAGSPLDIAVDVQPHAIQLSVGDRGPGIPPYDLERIFDKFYRVSGNGRRSSNVTGTGLGLAVCRGLVEAHGGRIWAENRPDGGTIFSLTLPLHAFPAHIHVTSE